MNAHRRREAKRARRRARLSRETAAKLPKPKRERPKPDRLVPIECTCDPKCHPAHWVPASTLKKGGWRRGRVKVDPGVQELLDEGKAA